MIKITQQMIEVSYGYGIKYANGDISLQEAIEKVVIHSSMNKNSASRAIQNMKCLINEEIYFNAMSANETIWRLEKIKEEYGEDKFLRVLKIVEKHLNTKESPNNNIREYINRNKK